MYNQSLFSNGLNGNDGKGLSVATKVASGGAELASTLAAAGVASQAIPIVGQILGGIALATGLLLRAKAKVNNIKANIKDVETQNIELRKVSTQLDQQIATTDNQMVDTNVKLKNIGLSGYDELSGPKLKRFFKKAFAVTPVGFVISKIRQPGGLNQAKFQTGILNDKMAVNTALQKDVETKVTTLQTMINTLESLNAKLLQGKAAIVKSGGNFVAIVKNNQPLMIAGLLAVAVAAAVIIKNKKKNKTAK